MWRAGNTYFPPNARKLQEMRVQEKRISRGGGYFLLLNLACKVILIRISTFLPEMKRRIEKAHIMNINIILLSNELMIKIRMVPYTKLQRGVCLSISYISSLREWGSNSNARVRIEQLIYCSSIYSRSPEKAQCNSKNDFAFLFLIRTYT